MLTMCKYCGHVWKKRTRNPVQCPLCKHILIEKPFKRKAESKQG